MNLEMMAVKDRALNAFMRPFFAQSINQAIRMFQDEINNKDGDIAKHADDYDLWHLGQWSDETGTVDYNSSKILPVQVAIGKNMKIA